MVQSNIPDPARPATVRDVSNMLQKVPADHMLIVFDMATGKKYRISGVARQIGENVSRIDFSSKVSLI